MGPERWERIETLYHQALALDPANRSTFLAAACKGDEPLQREIESLLAQKAGGRILDRSVTELILGSVADSKLTAGLVLGHGHYRIVEYVGAGGMGSVYRATDVTLGRDVALKLIRPEALGDSGGRARFEREARMLAALNHPHIATIYGFEEHDGVPFLALEYVPGPTLADRLRRGGLSISEVMLIGKQITEALQAAHAAGIIHRDLKPDNIKLTDGKVKLLDFGLAKPLVRAQTASTQRTPAVTEVTASAMIVGTAAYMSPEQASGKELDSRTDIWSFGCVLFEALTREPAFKGSTVTEILAAVLEREPDWAALPKGTPASLEMLLRRCLRKDPSSRLRDIGDARIEFEDLLGTAAQDGTGRRAVAVTSARRRRSAILILSLCTLALSVAGLWFIRRGDVVQDGPSAPVPLTSYAGNEVQPSFSPDGNQVAFVWDGERQDNADIYVKLIGSERPLRLTSDPAADISPAWSPDGRFIAFVRNQTAGTRKASILLVPAIGGTEKLVTELSVPLPSTSSELRHMVLAPYPLLAWAQAGTSLIFSDSNSKDEPLGLFVLSLETGEKRRLTSAPPGTRGDGAPAISPDGRNLIFSRAISISVSDLYRLPLTSDLRPAGPPVRLRTSENWNATPLWTLGGRDIIFSSGNWYLGPFTLWRMPALTAGAPQKLPFGEGGEGPALSAKRGRVVFSRVTKNDNIWRIPLHDNSSSARSPVKFIFSTRSQNTPQYSPDGRKVVFTSDRSGNWEVWVCERDGSNVVQLTSLHAAMTGSPHWSPDGREIVFDSNREGRFEIYVISAAGGVPRRLTHNAADNALASFAHDGQSIYFSSNRTASWEVWKMPASGGDALQVTHGTGRAPLESPDGKFLCYEKLKTHSLWTLPTAGGEETKVADSVGFLNFTLTESGIYFVPRPPIGGPSAVRFVSFDGKVSKLMLTVNDRIVTGRITISPDKQSLLYTQTDASGSDLMLVENYR